MKTYKKTATVEAKLFEKGDEDGFIHREGLLGAMEDSKYGLQPNLILFIKTLENPHHTGEFELNYICTGIQGERWLVEKSIFEQIYEEVITDTII